MDIQKQLRAALTICTLAGAAIYSKPAEGLAMEGEGEGCSVKVYDLQVHTVQQGEDLWDIARQHYGTASSKYSAGGVRTHYPTLIARENGFRPSDYIFPGQRLKIPGLIDETAYHCEDH